MQSKAKNTSISSKAAQRERAAQMAQQRAQQARLLLFIGAFAVLVAVIVVILIASRPADAPIPAEASTRYEGLTVGMTTDPKYPLAFPTIGDPNAPVKIEEISSFACPVCLRYHDDIFVNVLDKIKAGQVQYIYIPTTLTGDYTPAQTQAVTQAAYCAMQQNKFWPMHETLFNWQSRYGTSTADAGRLSAGASALGLDMGKFNSCLNSAETKKYVDDSNTYVVNQRAMVGTPSVFIYVNGQQIKPDTQAANITKDSMASLSVSELRGIIEAAAAKK